MLLIDNLHILCQPSWRSTSNSSCQVHRPGPRLTALTHSAHHIDSAEWAPSGMQGLESSLETYSCFVVLLLAFNLGLLLHQINTCNHSVAVCIPAGLLSYQSPRVLLLCESPELVFNPPPWRKNGFITELFLAVISNQLLCCTISHSLTRLVPSKCKALWHQPLICGLLFWSLEFGIKTVGILTFSAQKWPYLDEREELGRIAWLDLTNEPKEKSSSLSKWGLEMPSRNWNHFIFV